MTGLSIGVRGKRMYKMYRVLKVLNNNGILVYEADNKREAIVLGKGVGFGIKINERVSIPDNAKIYTLNDGKSGSALENAKEVEPVYFEIANEIIIEAEKAFGKIDNSILLPLADHIAFAIKRMNNGVEITNPLNEDIHALFSREYEVALKGRDIIRNAVGVDINNDEVGYITLHIHSALGEEKVAESMEIARALHECIENIEADLKISIDAASFSYSRLMSHIKYMVVRGRNGEKIQLDMNNYIKSQFPKAYEISEKTCRYLCDKLKIVLDDVEIGYLAMHIMRVYKELEID